jgi:hypothetical protein
MFLCDASAGILMLLASWRLLWGAGVPLDAGFSLSVYFSRLKGQCHEIFGLWFFYESDSPKPLSIPSGPFQILSKIRGDIRSSRCTTGSIDTSGKWKKSSIIKVLIILF